jgi:hypothetical protein
MSEEKFITRGYLKAHPKEIFVFGDNKERWGHGGAAALRDFKNTFGFITQKRPSNDASAHYKIEEYKPIFEHELVKLKKQIEKNPELTYLISRIGGGLANKFHIWENIIEPVIKKELEHYPNVKFLW